MKRIHIFLPLLILLGIVVIRSPMVWSKLMPQSLLPTISVGKHKLHVEIVDTPEKITLGLGERDEIGSDGMLFVLPNKHIPAFWMKGMRFPLDMVWIDTDTVVDIHEHVPTQMGVMESYMTVYQPKVPVTHVLELEAGQVQKRKIRIGDVVNL